MQQGHLLHLDGVDVNKVTVGEESVEVLTQIQDEDSFNKKSLLFGWNQISTAKIKTNPKKHISVNTTMGRQDYIYTAALQP